VSPVSIWQTINTFGTFCRLEPAKFSGSEENLSSQRILNKPEFDMYPIFSVHLILYAARRYVPQSQV